MKAAKPRTYFDRLMADKNFREKFEQEYRNLVISEKAMELRHKGEDAENLAFH